MRPPIYRLEILDAVAALPQPGCIIFSGKQQPNGYGRVSIDGHYERAHVYACRMAHGPAPEGKTEAAHSCGRSMCINPAHLRWATHAENERDKVGHGTSNRGSRCGAAVLSGVRVRKIRKEYAAGGVTQRQLADKNGVHVMTINDIIHRRTWAHF